MKDSATDGVGEDRAVEGVSHEDGVGALLDGFCFDPINGQGSGDVPAALASSSGTQAAL